MVIMRQEDKVAAASRERRHDKLLGCEQSSPQSRVWTSPENSDRLLIGCPGHDASVKDITKRQSPLSTSYMPLQDGGQHFRVYFYFFHPFLLDPKLTL